MAYSNETNFNYRHSPLCCGEPGVGAETGGSRVQDTNALDFQLGVESSAQVLSVQLGEATHEPCALSTA